MFLHKKMASYFIDTASMAIVLANVDGLNSRMETMCFQGNRLDGSVYFINSLLSRNLLSMLAHVSTDMVLNVILVLVCSMFPWKY